MEILMSHMNEFSTSKDSNVILKNYTCILNFERNPRFEIMFFMSLCFLSPVRIRDIEFSFLFL